MSENARQYNGVLRFQLSEEAALELRPLVKTAESLTADQKLRLSREAFFLYGSQPALLGIQTNDEEQGPPVTKAFEDFKTYGQNLRHWANYRYELNPVVTTHETERGLRVNFSANLDTGIEQEAALFAEPFYKQSPLEKPEVRTLELYRYVSTEFLASRALQRMAIGRLREAMFEDRNIRRPKAFVRTPSVTIARRNIELPSQVTSIDDSNNMIVSDFKKAQLRRLEGDSIEDAS